MSEGNDRPDLRLCPNCGSGRLSPRLISERYEAKDRGRVVIVETSEVPVEDCGHCGETFFGPGAVRIRQEALRRSLGLLTADQILEIRQQARLSPGEFASLLGVEEDDLTLWEQGRGLHDRIADNLMRVLSQAPETATILQGK